MASERECASPLGGLQSPVVDKSHQSPLRQRALHWFISSAAFILLITGLGKISSAFGTAKILGMTDPILSIPFRLLLPLVGSLELLIAALILWRRPSLLAKATLVAWISTLFVVYRIGLWSIGWHHPCGCMGSLAGALHLSDKTADTTMRILLAYLAIGACAGIVAQSGKSSRRQPPLRKE